MHAALEPHIAGEPLAARPRLGSAKVEMVVEASSGEYQVARTAGKEPAVDHDGYLAGVELVRLDTRTGYLEAFIDEGDLEVLKEGIEPYAWDDATKEVLSTVCQKDYRQITIYEVEVDSGKFAPFFEVRLPDANYDNRGMATGELSVLYLAWVLRRSEADSIILIEEPEAHLPPSSHEAVFSLIADAAVKKNLFVAITTHSPTIAEHVPQASLISIRSTGVKSSIPKKPETKMRVLSRLGLRPRVSACFFVEDSVAAATLKELLAWFDFHLVCNVEIVDTKGGDGAVKSAVESLPSGVTSIRFLGVVDGDAKSETKKWKCKDRIAFLPFDRPIEAELLDELEGGPGKGAEALKRAKNAVEDALAATRGQNHHDRLKAMSAHLQMSAEDLVRGALDRWRRRSGRATR